MHLVQFLRMKALLSSSLEQAYAPAPKGGWNARKVAEAVDAE